MYQSVLFNGVKKKKREKKVPRDAAWGTFVGHVRAKREGVRIIDFHTFLINSRGAEYNMHHKNLHFKI